MDDDFSGRDRGVPCGSRQSEPVRNAGSVCPRRPIGDRTALVLALLLVAHAGCGMNGEPYAEATGRVTIDGLPAAGVMVTFEPQSQDPRTFRPSSFGMTDADGRYRLMRRASQPGVVLGLHHVRVTPVEREGGKNTVVHRRYQENNALWADVVAGANTIDFDLRKDPTAANRAAAAE